MNVEFRSVFHFLWLENKNAKEIYTKMKETYGSNCPSQSMVYYWVNEFSNGRENVFDLPRSGGPKISEKTDDAKKIIDDFQSASSRYIAHIVGIDKNTVKRILIEDLHMKKVCFHWTPHDLTEAQKVQRVVKSKEFLEQLQSLSEKQKIKEVTLYHNLLLVA